MNFRVAVLRGGPSSEHNISLQTGRGVLDALQRCGISTVDIVINRQGEWVINGFKKLPAEALVAVDVAFVALHGVYGEDGQVQRVLENCGVRYTGSRPYPSATALNKILTKEILKETNIKMPAHLRVGGNGTDIRRVASTIGSLFGTSYVVKPINGGSSIDTHHANGVHELVYALTDALKKYPEVLVEEYIKGREATVGVLENFRGEAYYCLPEVEIVPPATHSFFAADVKYSGETDEICPGRFSRSEKEMLSEAALLAHQTLGLSHYSRSDFIVNDKGVYFLEVNTLPGLTKESLIPKGLSAVGHSYDDLIVHLVETAV